MESEVMIASPARNDDLSGSSNDRNGMLSISVSPSSDLPEFRLAGVRSRRKCDFAARALSPDVQVKGWFLPPDGVKVHGIRAVGKRRTFVARRKQIRHEVLAKFPAHPEALSSGFSIEVHLESGDNTLELQYKNAEKRWTTFSRCHIRLPFLWKLWRRVERHAPTGDYENWCRQIGDPSGEEIAAMRRELDQFPSHPLISVLIPVYNPPVRWLRRAIESVRAQIYPHWELCIADDHSSDPGIRKMLLRYSRDDSRIKVCFREENGHICQASNSALELCRGEYVALLDHDDELPRHALFHVAWEVAHHPDSDIVFSDEDKIDEHGARSAPYFKPGWNYDLLLGQNCVSHFGVFRTSLVRSLGGFRPGAEGSQDWDLTLRMLSAGGLDRVRHIPRVLYHWRTLATSTASSNEAKPYAVAAGRNAVADHLKEMHPGAQLRDLDGGQWQVVWPLPDIPPLVSIIIPTKDQVDLLRTTIESIQKATDYPNWEIVLVDHDSQDPEACSYIEDLELRKVLRRVRVSGDFNWSRLNNIGVHHAKGEVLLFLNNDVCVINTGWLTELVSHALRLDVGAVGACLLYPDDTIQHAGVVLGLSGLAGHVFRHSRPGVPSVGGAPDLVREVSAVTGACLAVRREAFELAGGFDEVQLPISYNDVDFCLRLRSVGLRNIYTPLARLVHHESASRAVLESTSTRKAKASEEARVMLQRWWQVIETDPFFNRNLSLSSEIPVFAPTPCTWAWQKNPGDDSSATAAASTEVNDSHKKGRDPCVGALRPTFQS